MEESTYRSNLSTNEKVLMAIVRAAEIFKRVHSGVFRNFGLSFPQYNILRVLEASDRGRNRITNVGRIMLVPGANMTGIAKRMEKKGFIVRKSDPADERVTLLEITPKGRKALKEIEKEKDDWLELMLKGLSSEEKGVLLELVKRLIRNNVKLERKGCFPEKGWVPGGAARGSEVLNEDSPS
ncbi:MAG: MarR family transcriptional regulator [Deltaproteobacteria bacterium]|nr:MarR family transcriptional regulator [Deltaproteobacteria bacterium]MBW2130758.1 MarR family transcriptional regulator [Deltaproteobacteria bacterium]MBW2302618.1 MarR family transcriptional regulator [Deltaproteobacteria bacterium]